MLAASKETDVSQQSPRLRLPYVQANQAQKHITLNECLWRLDALIQIGLESRSLDEPPLEAVEGSCWLIPPGGGAGDWSGRTAGTIVRRDADQWIDEAMPVGAVAFVADETRLIVLTASGWLGVGETLAVVGPIEAIGVGVAADTSAPLGIMGPISRFNADSDGDHRILINRADVGDTASIIFQTGHQGTAEIGLCGEDGLSLRTSDDGSDWRPAIGLTASGKLGVNTTSPQAVVHVVTDLTAEPALLLTVHSDTNAGCNVSGQKSRGSSTAPASVLTGDRLLAFYGRGWTSGGAGGNAAAVQMLAAENFTAAAQGTAISFETTPLGTAARRPVVTFQPNGALRLMPLAAAPASPQAGEVYFDQSLAAFRGWTGTVWTTFG